ncbi:ABC transporter [Jannaschia pagri]|uniref:ABC transporter n=1 Tax=Jannaschia pagri TaxID=2829797 RepID=A0ABQ4NLX5_9RHOB|nr:MULTISPECIES: peptidase domain-containing ABC transporter [unclassified Jannaschia]GIT91573.1 ABC transporter [Jannaschia sp. AI_61]GIT95407.1 ABC transporter [Jannaschia sp. AI_62]
MRATDSAAGRTGDVGGEIPFSWFGKTLWKFTPLYAELVFLAICLRLLGLVEPFIFQVIIDRILPFQREASLVVVIAVFAAVGLFQILFEVLSALLGTLTANRVTRELGARIFDHLFKLPFGFFRRWSVGETMARVGETDTIRAFLVGTTTGVFLDLIFVVLYIAVLLTLSPQLTLIVLAALPVQILIYLSFGPFLRRRLRRQFDASAAHQTQMVENISGIAAVKALSAERQMLDRLDRTLGETLDAGYRIALLNIWSDKLLFLVDRTITIAIIYFGAQMVFAGQMTLGELIAFHLLVGRVTGPIENFSGLWEAWQNIRVSRQRMGDVVNQPMEPFDALPSLPQGGDGVLRFDGVSFAHDANRPILTDLSMELAPGTLTLVVGPSGVGKSTFGRLAAGIEAPDAGRITLGGADISRHDPHDVRTRIAYVPQDPYLFTGTLRENLLIGREEATEADIRRALRITASLDMVDRLPQGLDTHIGERGGALSGGQRQRLAVARSLLGAPSVLILDEPTSALDATAQRRMAEELMALRQTAVVVVITHAPDLFPDADTVLDFGALP